MTNSKEVISTLKLEAKKSPAADAVFHVWALRKRARSIVTLAALDQKMRQEGFHYAKSDYAPLLKLLASLGVGHLSIDSKGRVVALKDIKTTLQSLGKAICEGEASNVKTFRKRARFTPVPAHIAPEAPQVKQPMPGLRVQLSIVVNDKAVRLPTEGLSPEEIALLLGQFRKAGVA